MTSKEIRFFGLMISLLLVLFIVLFFGKKFYNIIYNKTNISQTITTDSNMPLYKESALKDEIKQNDTLSDLEDKAIESKPIVKAVDKKVNSLTKDISRVEDKENSLEQKNQIAKNVAKNEPLHKSDINTLIKNLLEKGNFFRQSDLLQKDDKIILDKVVKLVSDLGYPYTIEVEGYTQEGVSSDVSVEMAFKVGNYLKKSLHDIEIQTKGYASQYPISGDIYSSINRRINILVRRK